MEKLKEEQRSKRLDQVADYGYKLSCDIGNLAGMACLLRNELDDSDKVYPVHRQTMATLQSMLEHLEADTDAMGDLIAMLQHDQMKRDIVYVPMSKYEAVGRDMDRCRAKYNRK